MKRSMKMGAAVFAAALTLAACGSSDDSTDNKTDSSAGTVTKPSFAAGTTMDRIQKAGKVTVGVKYDQPGFGQINPTTNKPEGFDVEVAKLIAQGIFGGTKEDAASKITYVEAKSKDREPFIQQDKVDYIVATYTINDARKQVIDFGGPYYMAHGDVLVKSDNNTVKTLADLNGKKVCVVQGSTYPATLTAKVPQATQLALSDYSSCENAVKDGRVDAMATDGPILIGLVSKSNGSEKVLNLNYTDEPYGVGLKKADTAFRNAINDRLQTIYDNGNWKSAFDSTLGKLGVTTPEPPKIDRY